VRYIWRSDRRLAEHLEPGGLRAVTVAYPAPPRATFTWRLRRSRIEAVTGDFQWVAAARRPTPPA
jgi:hypothetical protein